MKSVMLQQKFTARNYESVARNWNDPPKKTQQQQKTNKKTCNTFKHGKYSVVCFTVLR